MQSNRSNRLATVNPATGVLIRSFEPLTAAEIEQKLQRAATAFPGFSRSPFAERSRSLARAAEILESEKETFGRLMTLEMGKPFRAAMQEAEKCALGCRYYAEHGAGFLQDEVIATGVVKSFVRYQSLGPVLAIMPWNFPFWQVFRFAAPALMAGNVGLLKHASNVPQCALAIEDVFRRAGLPDGVFQTLLIRAGQVNDLIVDSRIAAVTLTGSLAAGQSVAAAAGKAIKKSVLELGGSDPFVIMPSADLERAAQTAVQARIVNNGQSCIAAKRFIVHERIASEFIRLFVAQMRALKVGNPMDLRTDIGPLATPQVLADLQRQVDVTIQQGAKCLLGGRASEGPGNFFPPTVLTAIPRNSPAYSEELFGPVASVFTVNSPEAAVELANDTCFGLGAVAWTNDTRERELFINELQSGLVFINGMVASDPRLPFGGVKQSGYGRELSHHGIREFVNAKTVCIA
jgi:succinate-semialdehyde dehydrogenase/glutarate-semialdehyde dehydrogenase